MIHKNVKESLVLAGCITGIGFIGEAFTHFTPKWLYLSSAGLDQIFISLIVWWMVATIIILLPVYFGINSKFESLRRLCYLSLASILLVLLFIDLLKIADIKLSDLLPPLIEKVSPSTLYLIAFISLFAIFALLKLTDKKLLQLANASKAICAVFFVLLMYRVYNSNFPVQKIESSHKINQIKLENRNLDQKKRRVIFIVFDEFDPSIAFADGSSHIHLPNFEKLIRQSFHAPNALPPAKSTAESIPAMLMGTPTNGNIYNEKNNLYVKVEGGELIEFNHSNSIFSKVPGGPQSIAILGFYHPYCKIFNSNKCISFPYHNFPSDPTSLRSLIPRSITGELRNSHKLLSHITEKQLELLPYFLNDKSKELTYIHLNIPHLEAHYAAKILARSMKKTPDDSYALNLELSDRTLGTVMEVLRKNHSKDENILLIVCSDHWFRNSTIPRDESKGLPALLIAKSLSDDKEVLYQGALSTHHLPELAIDFLNGKITNNLQITNWYSEKPIYKTFIGGSKWANE